MMNKAPHIPVSCWNFYFNVDSIKGAIERVNAGGGKVLNGPMVSVRRQLDHQWPRPAGRNVLAGQQ